MAEACCMVISTAANPLLPLKKKALKTLHFDKPYSKAWQRMAPTYVAIGLVCGGMMH